MFRTCIYPLFLSIVRLKLRLTRKGNLVILCYHKIRKQTGIFYDSNISATPEEFKRQISYINNYFNVVSAVQLLEYCRGHYDLKPNSIMITFDDGFKDNVLNAFPVLESMGIPAVVFPTAGFIDTDTVPWEDQAAYFFHQLSQNKITIDNNEVYSLRSLQEKAESTWRFCKRLKSYESEGRIQLIEDLYEKYHIDREEMKKAAHSMSMGYMTGEDIQYWKQRRIDFGIHTVTHPCLTTLHRKAIRSEISTSKKILETILKRPVHIFAYPYGKKDDYDETTKTLLAEAGIKAAMIFEPGINGSDSDCMELHRMGIARNMDFRLACHGFTSYWDVL